MFETQFYQAGGCHLADMKMDPPAWSIEEKTPFAERKDTICCRLFPLTVFISLGTPVLSVLTLEGLSVKQGLDCL